MKTQCAVRGLIAQNQMCGAIIVGGVFCGSEKPCQYKTQTQTQIPNTNPPQAAPHDSPLPSGEGGAKRRVRESS